MKLQLYPWQAKCLDAWSANGHHGIVNVVTGAGKTILALAAIERLNQNRKLPVRVRIVVPTTFLLNQWLNACLEYSDNPPLSREDIGYYYGSHKDSPDRSCMIYVINSARYALARHILDDFKQGYDVLLIADECHHYASVENRKIFDFLPFLQRGCNGYYSLGLSATPRTQGYESVLVPALGPEIYRYGFSEAAEMNTVNRFALFQIALSFDNDEKAAYDELSDRLLLSLNRLMALCPSLKQLNRSQFFGSLQHLADGPESVVSTLAHTVLVLSYQRKTLVCNASSRLSCACRLIASLDAKARIILFGERIEQADAIYRLLDQIYPGQAARCHSGMGKQARKNALNRYRDGEVRLLVSCRALDEGFDVPSASVGIVLSSSSVERQRIQRLGRILRRQEGKDISCLYYLYLEYSTEESSFFPHIPKSAISCRLSYSVSDDAFCHPEYEETAVRVLEKIKQSSPDRKLWKEAETCLLKGLLRPDWLLEEDILKEHLSSAKSTGEKNYWLCMEQMQRFSHLKITP